jgi:hypothetical protein
MFIAYAAIAVLLALGALASATAQITRNKVILENLVKLGIPLGIMPVLATCLIAGGVGLLAGLWYRPLGIAAAIGLVLYFKGLPAPGFFLVVAAAALSLHVLSV